MKWLDRINLVLVTVLSLAAAIPKIGQFPNEVEFFESAGLGKGPLLWFGVFQLAAGALLVLRKTRLWGAAAAALAFLCSAAMLFLTGQTMFGAVSLVPALVACAVAYQVARDDRTPSA